MEEILKQFDAKFGSFYVEGEKTDFTGMHIKDFLTTVIAERDKKMVEKLEGEMLDFGKFHSSGKPKGGQIVKYYNQALSDAISIIKEFNK